MLDVQQSGSTQSLYPSSARRQKILKKKRLNLLPLLWIPLLLFILQRLVRGDELTGMAANDPKDLMPVSAPVEPPPGTLLFQPLPSWAHIVTLATLPDKLKPLGKSPMVAAATPPASPPTPSLAPPKDVPQAPASTTASAETTKAKPTPATASASTPALIAVSPFLQWIKANPQAASTEARQQANAYQSPTTTTDTGTTGGALTPSTATPVEDPYWLPPMIDSPTIGTPGPQAGSAAIYQTPQR